MKKLCTICGEGERVYYRTTCKSCNNKKKLKWLNNKKDGYHSVYILQNDNYAGVTDNVYARMNNHKRDKRDVSDYRVLYKTKDRDEAEELEELLHDMGYEGRHTKNSIKYR